MNLIIHSAMSKPWSRLSIHYVTLAAGLAVAVAAAFGIEASQNHEAAVSAPAGSRPVAAIARNAQLPQLTVYLVESQEQARLVRDKENEAMSIRYDLNMLEPTYKPMILVMDSPEASERALASLAATAADGMAFGSFVVESVDLRGR